jgi:hypothetical protein
MAKPIDMSQKIRLLSALLVICPSIQAAHAAENDAPLWMTSATGLLDARHGYLVDGSLAYLPTSRSTWTAELSRSSTPEAFPQIDTDAASLGYSQALGPGGFGLRAHWFENVGLLQGRDITLQVPWRGEHWHVAVAGQYRQSSFDPFAQTGTVVVHTKNGSQIPVSGTASCDLDNAGYSAELGLDGTGWNAFVRDTQYEYGTPQCSLSGSGAGALSRPDLAELRQLLPTATGRLSRKSALLLGDSAQNSLLASEFTAGARYALGTVKLGLNYLHGRDELQGLLSDTYTASVDFPVARRATLQLQAGATDAQSVGTVGFLGLTFKTAL